MSLSGWQRAVYEALCDLSGPGCPCVSRHDLLQYRLFSLMERAGSHSRTPGQDVSLALQRLRDKGLVEFVGVGTYRLKEPGTGTAAGWHRRPLEIETGVTMTEQIVGHKMASGAERERRLRVEAEANGSVVRVNPEVVPVPVPSGSTKPVAEAPAERLRRMHQERMARRQEERTAQLERRRHAAGAARDAVKIVWIPLSKLRKGEINRDLDYGLIWAIALNFEWESLQALTVEESGDDTFKVREGHHRYDALQLVFSLEPDTLVPCVVTRARGAVAAATTVGNINITRKSWTGLGKFTLKVHQEDEDAIAVLAALERYQLRPAEKVGKLAKSGDVTGVVAMYACARRSGMGAVERMLRLHTDAWGRDPEAFRVGIAVGTWDFLLRYCPTPEYREEVLSGALRGTKVAAVYDSARLKFTAAKASAAIDGRPNAVDERTAFSWVVFDLYTAHIRGKHSIKRLPEFGLASTPSAAKASLTQRIKEYQAWEHKQA